MTDEIVQRGLTRCAGNSPFDSQSTSPPLQTAQQNRSTETSPAPPPPQANSNVEDSQDEQRTLDSIPPTSPAALEDTDSASSAISSAPTPEGPPAEDPPNEPQRKCLLCLEFFEAKDLVKACRTDGCMAEYDRECLAERFDGAISSPLKCCSIMQLYVLPEYPPEKADVYRRKMEEWLTPDKFYCPVQHCSVFIPPRQLPKPWVPVPAVTEAVLKLLTELERIDSSRFFHGDDDISRTQEFKDMGLTPLSLEDLRERASRSQYTSITQFGDDVYLIAENGVKFDTTQLQTITKTANGLEAAMTKALSSTQNPGHLLQYKGPPPSLPCPKCHTNICNKGCKGIAHDSSPCDYTGQMRELKMVADFGYKTCPACKNGVRRMHGCEHMTCTCGASWCWFCKRSRALCHGSCRPGEGAYDENFNDFLDFQLYDDPEPSDENTEQGPDMPRNLDGGGDARWLHAGMNFGQEAEETGDAQIWSCTHRWRLFKRAENGCDDGDLSGMTCNRCTTPVAPTTDPQFSTAFDCIHCSVIVCGSCMDKYNAESQRT